MAKGKHTSSGNHTQNDDRPCGKAWKKHSGVAPGAHNGHSIGGYSIKKWGIGGKHSQAPQAAA